MACTPTPTATEFGLLTSSSQSTSFSQSVANTQAQLTTIVQQICVASGTVNGSVGCTSSAQVTQVDTVGGGGGQTIQVPIVVNVPVTGSQPTQTLFAPCNNGGTSSSQSSSQSPSQFPLTTSVLVQSTPPPSTVTQATSTTLSDGSVMQTVVTVITTPPPTAVYVPTTALTSATLQSNSSQSSGTNIAPIVGGVLGGFFGLIAIVGSLWWLCRRRRYSWDDIFEKAEHQDDSEAWAATATRGQLNRRGASDAEPRPYQYGLVGHVTPPVAAGEPLRSSQYSSFSEHSRTHSRQTSLSATPLLQGARSGSSRPSTAGSTLNVQAQPAPSIRSPVPSNRTQPNSLSIVSHSSSTGPLLDNRSNWTPNTDDSEVLERTGSPVLSEERRILQIVNDGPPSPTGTVVQSAHRTSSVSSNVIMHTDGGPMAEGGDINPPAYSR